MTRRSRSSALFWTVLAVSILVMAAVRQAQFAGLVDQGYFAKYPFFADEIIAGRLPAHRLGDLSPLYLWIVTLLKGWMTADFATIRTLQIWGVAGVAMICAIGAHRLGGRPAAVVAACVVVGDRAVLVNATEAEPEILVVLFGACALSLIGWARQSRWCAGLAGLAFGLSAVTRPTVIPAAVAAGLWLWWTTTPKPRWKPGVRGLMSPAAVRFMIGLVFPILVLKLAYASIPGVATLMNPGAVFYEGNNPGATGVPTTPQIVKDLEAADPEPDAMHVAFRTVAGRALGIVATGAETNRFWFGRARAFLRANPGAGLRIFAGKARLALGSYDSWDLSSMVRKERELARGGWIPFGWALWAALVGLWFGRRRPETVVLALFAVNVLMVLMIFYFSSRQRTAMLPALALLAGIAATEMIRRWNAGRKRSVAAGMAVVIVGGIVAGLGSNWQREDLYSWTGTLVVQDARIRRRTAQQQGDTEAVRRLDVIIASWLAPPEQPVDPIAVRSFVHEALSRTISPARRFDLAVASTRVGDWATASHILEHLDGIGYRPIRGIIAPSSVAYQRARCSLHLGRRFEAEDLILRALRELPGHHDLLALFVVLAETDDRLDGADAARSDLYRFHDPFTADLALARAWADVGDSVRAEALLAGLRRRIPEWRRISAPAENRTVGKQRRMQTVG